jgi:hypothetical protein
MASNTGKKGKDEAILAGGSLTGALFCKYGPILEDHLLLEPKM